MLESDSNGFARRLTLGRRRARHSHTFLIHLLYNSFRSICRSLYLLWSSGLNDVITSRRYGREQDEREAIWTFPRRWRVRFFVLFYVSTVGTTGWGTKELIAGVGFGNVAYRDSIVIYVESIAGSVVTSMLIIDLLMSLKMLSNAIEDWLIERRKKRAAEWRERDERLRTEGIEYGRLAASYEARGEEPPSPPWHTHAN